MMMSVDNHYWHYYCLQYTLTFVLLLLCIQTYVFNLYYDGYLDKWISEAHLI